MEIKTGDILNVNLKFEAVKSRGCKGCYFDQDGRCTNSFDEIGLECVQGAEYFNFILVKKEVK